jgi:hypothetical protein
VDTPPLKKAKVKRREAAFDRDNTRVDRILENIPDLKSLGKLGKAQLPKEFKKWKADKEEIGAYEYNYSREEITIEADRGTVHENAILRMSCWLGNLAESNKNVDVSLREGTLVYIYKS